MKRTGGHPLSSLLSLLSAVECFPTSISQCGGLRNRHTSAEEDGPGHCLAPSGWGGCRPHFSDSTGLPSIWLQHFVLGSGTFTGAFISNKASAFYFQNVGLPRPADQVLPERPAWPGIAWHCQCSAIFPPLLAVQGCMFCFWGVAFFWGLSVGVCAGR